MINVYIYIYISTFRVIGHSKIVKSNGDVIIVITLHVRNCTQIFEDSLDHCGRFNVNESCALTDVHIYSSV